MKKCTYCEHEYSSDVRDDINQEVFEHVRQDHPKKYGMIKPADIWTQEVTPMKDNTEPAPPSFRGVA